MSIIQERNIEGGALTSSRLVSTSIRIIGVASTLLLIIYLFDIPRDYFGFLFYPSSHSALHLSFMIIAVFFLARMKKSSVQDKVPWYDILFILAGLVGTVYIFLRFPDIYASNRIFSNTFEQILGWITLIVVAEAVRRTVGLTMVIIPLIFIFHAKFAHLFPGLLGGLSYSWSRVWAYMYIFETGIFGMVLQISATIILSFILFGSFLQEAGAGKFFTDLGLSVFGRLRGGPAKVTLITTGLLGMVTGSPIGNAGTVGPMTIPLMRKGGFSPEYSAGVLSVAATGATLVPPVMGAVAFLMAHYSGTSYGVVTLAAILPAILYYACLYFQVDFKISREKMTPVLNKGQIPSFNKVFREGWLFLLPLVVLVILLMVMNYEPELSVLYATGSLIVVSLFRKETRLTPRKILAALENTVRIMVTITPVCALAGIITGSIAVTGLGINLSVLLTDIAGGNLLILALLAWAVGYIAGMGIAVILTYILMALLIAPAMVQLGPPVLAVHMFIFYAIMSMFFTPPMCPTVWIAAGMAKAKNLPSALVAMRLGIVAYIIPFVILYKPALVLLGTPLEIALSLITSLLGALLIAAGIEGYLLKEARFWERLLFLACGICLFVPDWQTDLIGFVIASVVVLSQWKFTKT